MLILTFLPDSIILFFCNSLLLVGLALTVAGFFAHRIPLVWQYQLPFKVLGIALLVLGVYFRGGYAVEANWRARVAEVTARLAIAEKASAAANETLAAAGSKKINTIKNNTVVVRQYIDREVVKYDNTCVIPAPFVQTHNRAAEPVK
jgi:hypothetical protein